MRKVRWKLKIAVMLCCLAKGSQVCAVAVYDAETNTITLGTGNNTLNSIYNDIAQPTALDYDGSSTYTLDADITGANGVDADLILENSTLIIAASKTIKTWSDLTIRKMAIQGLDPNNPWKIWAFSRFTSYSIKITDSDISGGQIVGAPNGYVNPSTPTVITNNYFHDLTIDSNYMLALQTNAAVSAYLYNNTFENIHQTSSSNYDGIIKLHGYSGLVMDKIIFKNCSVPANSYGMIYFYGTAGDPAPVVSNITMQNCQGLGFCGKEYGNILCRDCVFTSISRDAVRLYHSKTYGNTKFWIWNILIDGANSGIAENGADFITTDIYNVIIKNVATVFKKCSNGDPAGNFYITNSTASNYTTLYSAPSGAIRVYELTDIYVVDKNGRPVNNAVISIFAKEAGITEFCINRQLQVITGSYTLSNGHTPLPQEDIFNTLALLRLIKTSTSEDSGFVYKITAVKEGFSNSVEVQPEISWYRIDSDIYQNTITIILPMEIKNDIISGKTTVFPNPYIAGEHTNGNIAFARLPREATVTIYTASGELVKKLEHKSDTDGKAENWDIRDVAGGIYLYVIISKDQKINGKLSIVK